MIVLPINKTTSATFISFSLSTCLLFDSSVYSKSISVMPGYNYVALDENFEVMPGDLLAHIALSQPTIVITDPTISDEADWICASITATNDFTSTDCSTTSTEVHQLKAIYSQKSSVLLPLTFTSAGNYTIQVRTVDTAKVTDVSRSPSRMYQVVLYMCAVNVTWTESTETVQIAVASVNEDTLDVMLI